VTITLKTNISITQLVLSENRISLPLFANIGIGILRGEDKRKISEKDE